VLDEGDECDDGNLLNEDACANSCTENACGNARIDPKEQCDDGNTHDLDACSNACTRSRCRNGVLDPGEECDDGNTDHNDGCSNACELVRCGDGQATNEEECDDGNRVDADACSNACTVNACNNGRLDPGEACDGGLTAGGEPIAQGSVCNAACDAVESDMCGACEQEHCTDYEGSGVDLTAYCYDTVPEGSESITDFNRKCTELIQCIRASECDVGAVLPDAYACYCGRDTTLDECSAGIHIVGPCIAEFEAATDAAPGDYVWVSNYGADTTTPSGFAYYLAQCHRDHCLDVCR
jgi:cysteine-rich repeat protein